MLASSGGVGSYASRALRMSRIANQSRRGYWGIQYSYGYHHFDITFANALEVANAACKKAGIDSYTGNRHIVWSSFMILYIGRHH